MLSGNDDHELRQSLQQGFGLKVLGSVDWGNPADCGMCCLFPFAWRPWVLIYLCNADYSIYEQAVNATHLCTRIFYNHD